MKSTVHNLTASPALRRLLLECQTFCTADCCKQNAFQITDKRIAHWLEGERNDRSRELGDEIIRIEADLRQESGQVFLAIRDLESTWDAAALRDFWGSFAATYSAAVKSRQL